MRIEKVLSEVGLTKNKAAIYLVSLELGPASVQQIADRVKLPRTTVHEILSGLLRMGLVSFVNRGRTRVYTAEKPQKLKVLLKQKEALVDSILPELASITNTRGIKPRVRFFEGVEGIKTVFEDTLTSEDDTLRGVLSMADLYKIPGKEYMEDYVKRRVEAGFKLNVVRSKTTEAENTWATSMRENRELRYAPEGMVFPMTIYIYDFRKVGLIGTEKENFGMIIESEDLYTTIKNMFEIMWHTAPLT
jgi:HTH-type transcriptional regulator, sugar sensing transcriptional regulator